MPTGGPFNRLWPWSWQAGAPCAWAAATRACGCSADDRCLSTSPPGWRRRSAASQSAPTAIRHASTRSACQCSPTPSPAIPDRSPASWPACDGQQGLGASHILSLPTDTPFFPHDLAARLASNRLPCSLSWPHRMAGAIRRSPCGRSTFMHGAMMEAAQRDEIGRLGLAAIRPVLDVVHVDVARVAAAGKAAALVARGEQAAQRRGDDARLAADVERLAVLVLDERDDAGVAGEAARGFGGDGGAVLDLAAAGARGCAGSRRRRARRSAGDPPPGDFEHVVREKTLGDAGEGVGAPRAEGHDLPGRSRGNVLDVQRTGRPSTATSSAFMTRAPVSAGRWQVSTSEPSSS